MAITESDLDVRGQMRFLGVDGVDVWVPGEDTDGILTTTAIAVGDLTPNGVMLLDPTPPTNGPWELTFATRVTFTIASGGIMRFRLEGKNQLGEDAVETIDKTNSGATVTRSQKYWRVLSKITIESFDTAGNITVGVDHPNQMKVPLPFVPIADQAANEIGDVGGAVFMDAGGGTYALGIGEAAGAFTVDKANRTMQLVNTVTTAATQPILYRVIGRQTATYRGDLPT